jgi:hypothetical protein
LSFQVAIQGEQQDSVQEQCFALKFKIIKN